jgi:hypothetical protein
MIGMISCQRAQAVLYVVEPLINLSFETPMNDFVGRKGNNYGSISHDRDHLLRGAVALGISHSILFVSPVLPRQVDIATSPRSCELVERRDIPVPSPDQANHKTLGMSKQIV